MLQHKHVARKRALAFPHENTGIENMDSAITLIRYIKENAWESFLEYLTLHSGSVMASLQDPSDKST